MPPNYEVWTFFGNEITDRNEVSRSKDMDDEAYRVEAHKRALFYRELGHASGKGVHTIVVETGSIPGLEEDVNPRDHSIMDTNSNGTHRPLPKVVADMRKTIEQFDLS